MPRQMKTRVITLMWGTAWDRYGRKFYNTFRHHWPREMELVIFTDQRLPIRMATQLPLGDDTDAFRKRWAKDRRANGYEHGGKVDAKGQNWRFDAVKWAPQGIVPKYALDGMEDGDILCWLDADVETTAPVAEDWVERLLKGKDLALLKRENQHSEIGFWAIRVSAKTRALVQKFSDLYTTGDVFRLGEWHSAYVFDRAVAAVPSLTIRNLCPGKRGYVFEVSPLAECLVHKKGKRKDQ